MSGVDTPIPVSLVAGWAALAALLVVLSALRLRGALRPRYIALLLVIRVAALTLVSVLLLRPYRVIREPDRDRFQVALLIDCSASMGTRDCAGGGSRLDVLRQRVVGPEGTPLLDRLGRVYRVSPFLFSDKLVPHRLEQIAALAGPTALGAVLADCRAEFADASLGAVCIASDGNSNSGVTPTEVGKRFQRLGIPVSCVGVGESSHAGDVAVSFTADRISCAKGEAVTLPLRLRNTLDREVRTRVEISSEKGPVAQQEVRIPADGTTEATFIVRPWRAGYQTYAARIPSLEGDNRPETDVDYAGLDVAEPDTFRILFLSARLGWEYKFVKLMADPGEQLSLRAVIRTGPTSYYVTGLSGDEARLDAFPDAPALLNAHDVIVLDTSAVELLPERAVTGLRAFVADRGGGLLCLGPVDGAPDWLGKILPVASTDRDTAPVRRALQVNPAFIFDDDPTGVLTGAVPLSVAPGDLVVRITEWKKGARPALLVGDGKAGAMVAHSYGSGRTAYLGIDVTWRWRLASHATAEIHDRFWRALFVWLGSTAKQRLQVSCDGRKFGLGEEVDLHVDVLGADYLPAPDAKVSCVLRSPSGEVRELQLNASSEALGRYGEILVPDEPGEYAASFRIKLPGESLEVDGHFLARGAGVETANTEYREGLLRDLARITGGLFRHYRNLDSLQTIPLSASVPMTEHRCYWADAAWLLVLAPLVFGCDWYLRRRVGLK